MTTKTINVSIEDAQEGDLFTGTIEYAGATIVVTGTLKGGEAHGDNLHVVLQLPYAVRREPAPHHGSDKWHNVTITREVKVPEFKPGTIVKWNGRGAVVGIRYLRESTHWVEFFDPRQGKNHVIPLYGVTDADFQTWLDGGDATIVYNPEEAS